MAACGGDGVVLPNESNAAAISIVSGDNQAAGAGVALGQPLVVRVVDGLNRPVSGETVAFTVEAGGGAVLPTSGTTGADGRVSTAWTLGPLAGTQRVRATVTGSSPALVVTFTATASSGTGAALTIVSGNAQTAPVKSALADSLVVKVTDVLGNPVSGVQVDWTVTGGGTVSPSSVPTDASGLAATERVLGTIAGPQGAQASSAGLTPVAFTHTAIAANPTNLVLISGNAQTGAAGQALPESLVVRLQDSNGNGVGGQAITWLVSTGGGSVSPVNAQTSASGLAKTEWTLGTSTGNNVANAVFSGLPPVQFTATAGAGAPAKLGFLQQPVTTTAGSSITPAVRVAIQDANGNTVTSATGSISVAIGTNPAGGTLSGTTSVAVVNGVASFSNLAIDKTGAGYTLTASSAGLPDVPSAAFDILTGSANRLVFIVQPADRVVGQTFSPAIQVQARDAGGNVVLSYSGTVTLTSSVTGSLTGSNTASAFLGTATFSNLAVSKAGTGLTLTALASGLASATSTTFNVAQAATTTAITTRNPSSSIPGQSVIVNYNVDVVSPGTGSLTGSVIVGDGTTTCTGGVAANGTGSCSIAFPDAGTHAITATYSGDPNFLGSTSASVNHTVNKANTAIAITGDSPDPSLVGEAVTVSWNLTSASNVPISGNVTITMNGGDLATCTAPASLGTGSCQLAAPAPTVNGSRTITASYTGDLNYNGSSDTEGHAVHGETSTSVASSPNPSLTGQSITFTAHVSVLSGTGNPTGTVQFLDGATVIGTDAPNGAGQAVFSTSSLGAGSHSITATYLGSGSFEASTSLAITQIVNQANRAPTAVADGPYTLLEDATLNQNAAGGVLANDSDPDGNAITAVLATGPSHAASFTLNPDGSFDYTPDPNYNGPDSFTYHANDGSLNSSNVTVTLSVTAVNDVPSFTMGGDQTVSVSAGAQTVSGWATNVSPGPSNESSQTLTFEVSTDNDAQFTALPAIDATTGDLTYTPDPAGAGATVTVTVRLRDSGGTANGGVDVTTDQTFTITLTTP